MTLPRRLRCAIGVAEGGHVEASVHRGKIVLAPKPTMDRSKSSSADDEYNPAQRRAVDRGIAQSEKEYKQGLSFGPFDSYQEFIASLHKEAKKPKMKKPKRAAR